MNYLQQIIYSFEFILSFCLQIIHEQTSIFINLIIWYYSMNGLYVGIYLYVGLYGLYVGLYVYKYVYNGLYVGI